MADQQKPNPAPAPKSSNLGQQLKEQPGETSEESAEYNPYESPEKNLGPQINTPSFQSSELGAQQRALTAAQAPKEETEEEEEEGGEEAAAAEEAAEEESADYEQLETKNREDEVLKGAGLETGPSVQEEIREELLKQRAIAAAKENAGEQLEEEEEQQQVIDATKKTTLPTPDKLNNDRVLDGIMISVLATKDIVDCFDYIGFGALSAAFFLVIVIVLRSMQKTRTNKSRAMIFGIILFLDAIPGVAMLFPSSVVMLYFLRFEDMENKLKTITGPLKSGK